jgi:hypothetical protein
MVSKLKKIFLFILVLGTTTGCSIKHHVASDYSQYLANNSTSDLPKTEISAKYSIDAATLNHQYEFRAATVGYAHLWIVEFGKMLDETLNSSAVKNSFKHIEKSDNENNLLIFFKLENYAFKHHHAYIDLNVSVTDQGKNLFTKTYHAEGKSQGAKMFWGGPFAMKNATQQSTKLALDQIFDELIKDTQMIINN